MFQEKDTVLLTDLAEKLSKSRENLLNTSLFNFVTIDTIRTDTVKMNIQITLIERWYLWPAPIFELADRNFNVWWTNGRKLSRTDYGFNIVRYNFRGRKETLKLKLQWGYNVETAFSYTIPYVNKKQTLGMEFKAGYLRNHEITYITEQNQQVFYKDSATYMRKRYEIGFSLLYRKDIITFNRLEVKYNYLSIQDTILKLNPDYFLGKSSINYLSLYYKYEIDQRDSRYYPLNGQYFSAEFLKNGLSFKLSSDYVMLNYKYYSQIYNRWYVASGLKIKLASYDKPPYVLQKGLGYIDMVRGYEYYVIDGQRYGLLKSELKYQLVPTRVTQIPFIKNSKFAKFHYTIYVNGYVDAGYVEDLYYFENNPLTNTFLIGGGLSLNYVTYYDKVLRIEYSINRMGETGLFFNVITPI